MADKIDNLRRQGIRAVIDDLGARIAPALTDPTAIATVGMAQSLLAHLQARRESERNRFLPVRRTV